MTQVLLTSTEGRIILYFMIKLYIKIWCAVDRASFVARTHSWTHHLLTGLDNLPTATAHTNTRLYITQSSAPDDGHMVARNMLSNY